MNLQDETTERLFSYGTLQLESVQVATFGRTLAGRPDALVGYRVVMIPIDDQAFVAKSGAAHHRTLQFTGVASDVVEGTVFSVTEKEIELADSYEPDCYKRVQVQLRSATTAWVYINKNS